METRLKKWGNSLALRIPRALATEIGLEEESPVNLLLKEGRLVIEPVAGPSYALEELLARVTPENLHEETDSGPPTGAELW